MATTVALGGNNGWSGLQDRESAGTSNGAQIALNTDRVNKQLRGMLAEGSVATDGSTRLRGLYFHRLATGPTVRLAANYTNLMHDGTLCPNADTGATYTL
jgi:hypothetical protein